MKNKLLLILFVFVTIMNAQNKVTDITNYDYCQVNSNTLYFYKIEKKGFTQSRGNFFHGNIFKVYATEKVDFIDKKYYGSMNEIKLSDLNSDFDLLKEFRDKVYFVNQPHLKHFYFLKNDSVLVCKVIRKNKVWELESEKEDEIHKIVMANNKIIYWSSGLGLIYKKDNEIKTSFLDLQSYYNTYGLEISIKDKNAVNMETGYFEIGKYTLKRKKGENYAVFKENQNIIDDLPLKYYNNKHFVTIDDKTVKFYNSDFVLDSTFSYRDIYQGYESIEILTENKIKKIDTRLFTTSFYRDQAFGCGTVTRYSLSIKRNRIRETVNAEMTYGYTSSPKNIFIDSKIKFDSLLFISRKKIMDYSVNGGFDDRVILIKNKKEGLYTFKQQNDTITLKEIVPIKYDKIYLLNGFVILNKNNQIDFYDKDFKVNAMRFTNIDFFSYNYLRYKKRNHTGGWMNKKGILFDDL
ncbi:hypothetical protein IRZ71_20300 [Flavobacterium sp. ANB]|uniref:hypothetical protein n=1 Tax=unclassified Flavobacterium TaxID=196869 RepID=UPI0012BA1B71|nr:MULTISPECIES: hypothetical protein [unclassified Flavobacterium]MBF4518704.1 hypothetical protein [Flavobacterium sp. ANB]MTD67791.1 hypothetical protein [Flavobacterium sp. LC2016-13]